MENEYPDIVVSIGTGFKSNISPTVERAVPAIRGVFSHTKALYKIARSHVEASLDSEMTWESYINVLQPPSTDRSRYVRLNPQLADDPPGLDEVHRMQYVQNATRKLFNNDVRIQEVALQLIASSFYFEMSGPEESSEDNAIDCKGLSLCHELRERFADKFHRPYPLPPITRQSRNERTRQFL